MRFGVLGPLAVWTDEGTLVKVPELKVRALLADLLVHEGRPVPADRLIEDLWGGERLPQNPVGTLQTRVSQLRRVLEQAERGARALVVSQPPGYLLRVDPQAVDPQAVDPQAVDAERWHSLVASARATRDARAKAGLFAEALSLWRGGSAYEDFADEEFVRVAVARLEEERLVVREEHAEVRLALGEHGELAGELSDLVERHPLRERLRAVQLQALYRAGRQTEALASYADLRERLAEDLGLDPGPELVAVHEAILRQDTVRSNLPAGVTDLIGRSEAVAEVRSLLETARLVTLTGPGGVGKTRLALEAARDANGEVWLVELAGLDRASATDALVDVVSTAVGVRDDASLAGSRAEPAERLASALRDRRLLLLLDNCEHVVEQVAELCGMLLRTAPGLRVLATSQEPIGIAGEALWTVPPLDLDAAERSSAVRLFAARAASAAPGFTVGPDNVDAVMAICRSLDGIPLALELAATRVRALGVHELARRLDDRFRLLTSGARDAPARQRTLRAVIDWSWEPLSERERIVLRRLAVHAGGCTLEAAEEVSAGPGLDACAESGLDVCAEPGQHVGAEPGLGVCAERGQHVGAEPGLDVFDALARLVDRSLVVMTDGPRYRLLESVRAYCMERLEEAGEAEEIRRRYVQLHVALAERAEPHLYGHDQRAWLERLDQDAANHRAALETAVQLQESDLALRLVNALAWYWFLRGRLSEGRRSFDLALGLGQTAAVRAWRAGFALLGCDGTDPQAREEVTLVAQGNVPGMTARAQWTLGFAYRGFGDLSVTAHLIEEALAEFRAKDERWGIAAALAVRATISRARSDLAAVRRDATESEALFRELGDRWGLLKATNSLAELAEIAGDYPRAMALHSDGLRLAEELGLRTEASLRLSGMGRISLLNGDFAAADEHHRCAMRLAIEQGNKVTEHFAEVGLALSARRQGRPEAAESHLRKWLGWIRQVDGEPGLPLVLAELGFAAEQRGDRETARTLHRDGLAAARRIGDPRAIALAYEGLAGVESDAVQAARLLGAAAALRASAGAPLPAAERGDVDRITAGIRRSLSGEAFTAAFEQPYSGDLE
ncbi:BTAD domain-containing putative transcriptional regulator [Actinomadura sp. 9N407]|uniref:BTAD domain-containing putative transcriptional regulator n=1 Tax=Actinomadura sp. 9N407 TaxID=3375154 RepID=UPI003795DE73